MAEYQSESGREAQPTPVIAPGRWRTILKWVAFVMGVCALLLGAVMLVLDTGPGRRLIADQIAELDFENGLKVKVGRIEGSIYSQTILYDVSFSDPAGVFLTSPEVHLDWNPLAYAFGHLDINSLTAKRARMQRLPQFRDDDDSSSFLPDHDIDIDEFRIDHFFVAITESGKSRVLSLDGETHLSDRRAQAKFNVTTIAGQTRAGSDRLSLVLDAWPKEDRLDVLVDIFAPADGVFAAMAGLTERLRARLEGDGDWHEWDGIFQAELGSSELAQLKLTGRDGAFSLRGPTRLARMFNGSNLAPLFVPVTNLDLTAKFEQRRAMLGGNISSDAFGLQLSGAVDLARSRFEDLRFAISLTNPFAISEGLRARQVEGRVAVNGDFEKPQFSYLLDADLLELGELEIADFRVSGVTRSVADHIVIPINARASRIVGYDFVDSRVSRDIRLTGNLAIEGSRIVSDKMHMQSDRLDANIMLVADTSASDYRVAVDGRMDEYRIESVGRFNLDTNFELEAHKTGLALAGRVRIRSTSLFNESLDKLLGGKVVAASDVRYGSDEVIRLADLSIRSPSLSVDDASGYYALDGRLALDAQAKTKNYGDIAVQLAGTLSDPRATITAERPGVGIGLANLRARVTGTGKGYRLDTTADTDYGPLYADVLLGTGEVVTLDIAKAGIAGIGFAGSLRQTPKGPFEGLLEAAGRGLEGTLRLSAVDKFQQARFNLRARNATLPGPVGLSIGAAVIEARVIFYDQPMVVADAQIAQASIEGLNLTSARAKIDYRDGEGNAQVLFKGVRGTPFRLAANAQFKPDLWRIALSGRLSGNNFESVTPARIIRRENEYELLPTEIGFTQGSLRLAGTYGKGISFRSDLDALDLALINFFISGAGLRGRATGSLEFDQPQFGQFPTSNARVRITNFSRTTSESVSRPFDINLIGKFDRDGGETRAVFRQQDQVVGRLVATLKPVSSDVKTWTDRLLSAQLGGGVRYNGPAATLLSFTTLADQGLTGAMALAADFSGQVRAPSLVGFVRADNLTYEERTYGTRLSKISVAGRFSGNRLEIDRLAATAGDGTVSAKGSISLAEASGFPMRVDVSLKNARLARSDVVSAKVSGDLQLSKVAGETAVLSGSIEIPDSRFVLNRQSSAGVPELAGVRFKSTQGIERNTVNKIKDRQAGLFDALRFDITFTASERLYVTGMGLESEWKAGLQLAGTAESPRVSGDFSLIRGTLGFAGRAFELSEGRVAFTGGSTINPVVAVTATEEVEDLVVNVNVTGRADDARITFSSVPNLPQDEILSRMLFGRSIASLSALQAVQLAASLNSLRSSGGGLNPIGKVRSATSIDRLRILGKDEASGRGTALAAGQYLTDDIYVELITDARGFAATQLEVSLTPFLSVLSQAGGSGETNVDIRYRKKY